MVIHSKLKYPWNRLERAEHDFQIIDYKPTWIFEAKEKGRTLLHICSNSASNNVAFLDNVEPVVVSSSIVVNAFQNVRRMKKLKSRILLPLVVPL